MARQETPMPLSKETPVNELVIAQDISAANQLALITREQNERVAKVARQLNYSGSTDLHALENSAHDAMKRVGMANFELGCYLLMLKEGCAHGEFIPVLERLSISRQSANKYMSVTQRFSNASTSSHLEKLGFSKIAELLPLDDEQINDLVGDGQTGELVRDDVTTMSVRELRAAVRKERIVKKRLEDVNSELNTELALTKNHKIAATDWPEAFKVLMDQAQLSGRTISLHIGALDALREEAMKAQALTPDEESSLDRARAALADELLSIHRKSAALLDGMGSLFSKTLGSFATESLYQ